MSTSKDSNAPQRRFKIQRRQVTPSEGSLKTGETLYQEFNGQRVARKQRVHAEDWINDLPSSAPQDVSPRLENKVPIPVLPPISSLSLGEGLLSSGVPLDLIPRDLASHHQFIKEWLSKLSLGKALQYGIRWEKVPGKEDLRK